MIDVIVIGFLELFVLRLGAFILYLGSDRTATVREIQKKAPLRSTLLGLAGLVVTGCGFLLVWAQLRRP